MKLKACHLIKQSAHRGVKLDYKHAHPMVISPDVMPITNFLSSEIPTVDVIDCPFDLFTIELMDKPDEECFLWGSQVEDLDKSIVLYNTDNKAVDQTSAMYIVTVLVQEISVGNYRFMYAAKTLYDEGLYWGSITKCDDRAASQYNMFCFMVQTVLQALLREPLGKLTNDSSVGYKYQGRRRTYAPRDVIYIGTKVEREDTSQLRPTREVDWTHRWQVRGHYRRINGYGKGLDRKGNRTVEGFTWVRPHVKGDGELIEKVRIVK